MSPATVATAPAATSSTPSSTTHQPVYARLGFWSALLTAAFSGAWLVTWVWQAVAAPMGWQGADAAAEGFRYLHILHLYPSILLAPTFLVLLSCLVVHAPSAKKVWGISALAIGGVYAAMASVNYTIQLVGVRMSLQAGATDGLEMFLQANPRSMFASLANAYIYMALAMFLAAFVFGRTPVERTARWLLMAAGLQFPLQLVWSVTSDGTPNVLALLAVLCWVLGAVVAMPLVAIILRRSGGGGTRHAE